MNFSKAMKFIADNNIEADEIFSLVNDVKGMNLDDEENIRLIIRKVSNLAHKEVPKQKEDEIVREIMRNGVNDSIFKMI